MKVIKKPNSGIITEVEEGETITCARTVKGVFLKTQLSVVRRTTITNGLHYYTSRVLLTERHEVPETDRAFSYLCKNPVSLKNKKK